jgi:hypothetical protein
MKKQDGLVLNAEAPFVSIKDIALVAVKRNNKIILGGRGTPPMVLVLFKYFLDKLIGYVI